MEVLTRTLPLAPPVRNRPENSIAQQRAVEKASFKEALENISEKLQEFSDIHKMLNSFQTHVIRGNPFSARDLLAYQIRASQFGLSVELISKAVDSGLTSVRKLQTNQ